MLIFDGKQYREATAEEMKQYENLPPVPTPAPTSEELLDILTGVTE